MPWKLLLPALVMVVAIHETVGQDRGPPPVPPRPGDDPTTAPPTVPGPGEYIVVDAPTCSVDIVFVVDESSSISTSWFDRVKRFIVDFLDCFTNLNDVWVGVIPLHCVPRTYLRLSPATDRDPFDFNQLMQKGGQTRAGLAIRFMKDTSYFRIGVPRAAVVLTDGQSDSPVQAEADAARTAGIGLYAVSIGDLVDNAELEAIGGSSDHVFKSDNTCNVATRILADLCGLTGNS
ncbi:COL6A6 [Branchiostoma lanceolatum]|uniref:COL6A6 protein n=1 Tax=Branchiostoma lanceolatum TaxID=7740 RepID=A0A8J9ZSR2_BRALA|nr:COL6A6 [Branchiostoma lanceolatum]